MSIAGKYIHFTVYIRVVRYGNSITWGKTLASDRMIFTSIFPNILNRFPGPHWPKSESIPFKFITMITSISIWLLHCTDLKHPVPHSQDWDKDMHGCFVLSSGGRLALSPYFFASEQTDRFCHLQVKWNWIKENNITQCKLTANFNISTITPTNRLKIWPKSACKWV